MDLPPEYVLHLLPLMAICGLSPTQTRDRSPSPTLQRTERTASIASEKSSSPRPTPTLASIPYIDPTLSRSILAYIDQWRTLALWEPFAARDRQVPGASLEGIFRVVPVDRVVPSSVIVIDSQSFRLPPQKTGVPGGSISGDKELHSPLSPLNSESPLYPDGIMTTMWIRKHRDIIPAVFVSFYELKSDERSENLSDEELARHLAELKYPPLTGVYLRVENPLPTGESSYVLFSRVPGNVSSFYYVAHRQRKM
jgi:trafficking protein particle complex subunit 11